MNNKQLQFWAPWALLVFTIAVWQLICTVFKVSEFIFPSPLRIATQTWEFKEVILGHAWRTYWVTMAGFGIAIVWACCWALWWARRVWLTPRSTR